MTTKQIKQPIGAYPGTTLSPEGAMINAVYGELPEPLPEPIKASQPFVRRFRFRASNRSVYELIYACRHFEPDPNAMDFHTSDRQFLLAYMGRPGLASAFTFSGIHLHWSYVGEKLGLNETDTNAILEFLESMGHSVGYCDGAPYSERVFVGCPEVDADGEPLFV